MQNEENYRKISFKDYLAQLPDDQSRTDIRNEVVPKYISYSSFYRKVSDNTFSELEFEKLEEITNQTFKR